MFRSDSGTNTQICSQNAGNAVSETQISKIFRGGCPPTPLRLLRCVNLTHGQNATLASMDEVCSSKIFALISEHTLMCDEILTQEQDLF
jgi:hypothetical protein